MSRTTYPPRGLVELGISPRAKEGAAILRDMLAGGGTMQQAVALLGDRSPHLAERMTGMVLQSLRMLDRAAAHGAKLTVSNDDGTGWAAICQLRGHARRAALENMIERGKGYQAMTLMMQAAEKCVQLLLERDGTLPTLDDAPQPAPASQRIDIAIKWPEGAVPVEVRRMPDSVSTTTLDRDTSGRLTGSTARTTQLND
jgi:hypothetical protein